VHHVKTVLPADEQGLSRCEPLARVPPPPRGRTAKASTLRDSRGFHGPLYNSILGHSWAGIRTPRRWSRNHHRGALCRRRSEPAIHGAD